MRPLFLASLLVSLIAGQQIEFINPPSPGEVGDYSLNPTFVLGSSINIQWTETTSNISMVLYQQREGDAFEYVFSDKNGITSFRWTVGTGKSLANGNVFFFQIFIVGETSPAAGSHYFNITRGGSDDDDDSSTSTTSSSTSATPTASSTSSTTSTTSTESAATSSSTPAPSSDSGMSTGAKVGIGVGIPIAVILGVAAGWFFFGRRKKVVDTPAPDYAPPHDGHYAPDAMQEQSSSVYKPTPSEIYTPPLQPVEMPNNQTARY